MVLSWDSDCNHIHVCQERDTSGTVVAVTYMFAKKEIPVLFSREAISCASGAQYEGTMLQTTVAPFRYLINNKSRITKTIEGPTYNVGVRQHDFLCSGKVTPFVDLETGTEHMKSDESG